MPTPVSPFIFSVDAIHPNEDSTEIVIEFEPGSDYGMAFVYLTPPLSPGVRKLSRNDFRIASYGPFGLINLSSFPTSVSIPIENLLLPVTPDTRVGIRLKALTSDYLLGGPTTEAILTVGPPAS